MTRPKVFNYQIILDALNKYTEEKFTFNHEYELWESKSFQVIEGPIGLFSLDLLAYDFDTGATNEFPLMQDETLADVIDRINKERGES